MSHDVYIRKIDLFIQVLDSHNGCRKIEKFSWNSFFCRFLCLRRRFYQETRGTNSLIFDLKTDVSQCLFWRQKTGAVEDSGISISRPASTSQCDANCLKRRQKMRAVQDLLYYEREVGCRRQPSRLSQVEHIRSITMCKWHVSYAERDHQIPILA